MLKLAQLIYSAATKRELSWQGGGKTYALTKEQAIKQASVELSADSHAEALVAILLAVCWNDALDWSKNVIKNQIA